MPRLTRSQGPRVHFGLVALASVALSLSLLGCRTPSSKIPLDQLSTQEQGRKDGEAREILEPLPVERPSDLLPAEVAAMAEALDPAALFTLVGSLDRFPLLSGPRGELNQALGGDIFDPARWAELGFDSHGPAGLGLLDLESEAGFLYLSLVDEAKFEQTLLRFADMIGARDSIATVELGDARVYRFDGELSVVVRSKIAMLVFVDHPELAPRDYVVTVATLDPRESLGHSERFRWARQQLQPADDGMVFFSPGDLLRQFEHEQAGHNDDYGVGYAEEELERARAAGDPPAMIRELEERAEAEREWAHERELRRASERELAMSLFGSMGAVVAGADLRPDGIDAHGRMLIPGAGLLRRLFVGPEHESPLLTALGEPPLVALEGRVDLRALLELAELLARADGSSLASINTEILQETGVDLLSEVVAVLDGEGGFVLTESSKIIQKRAFELPKSIGLAAYLGLTDSKAIRKVLDGMVRNKRLHGALVRAPRGDGWILRVPDWREVEINLVGERVVLSTDAKLATRIRDAEPGAAAPALASAGHPLRGPLVNPALRLYGRWSAALLDSHRAPWLENSEFMLYDINSHSELSVEEAAAVPYSREYKRKLAELDKAVAEFNDSSRRQLAREFERDYALVSKLGDAGLQLEPLVDGLGVRAQWRFSTSMTPFEIGYVLMSGDRQDADDDWAERERLLGRAHGLSQELRQLRAAELDAAAAKRRP